jgi:hypothetical protein
MIETLIVPESAYPYLVAQRGALDDMKGDSETWLRKYSDVLADEYRVIARYLPPSCRSILDVGSGMGGLNVYLNEHFGGCCDVTLLDGVDDPPNVELHRKTFNHMQIARLFLGANGVEQVDFIDANDAHRRATRTYDLIVSKQSWCFHYEPQRYLDLVLSACHPRTKLIVDVRRQKPQWLGELLEVFRHDAIIYDGVKTVTHGLSLK